MKFLRVYNNAWVIPAHVSGIYITKDRESQLPELQHLNRASCHLILTNGAYFDCCRFDGTDAYEQAQAKVAELIRVIEAQTNGS